MKTESPGFTREDVEGFVTDYLGRERGTLTARLRRVLDDVDTLVSDITSRTADGSDDSWNAIEVLAHMATTAHFFGRLAHMVASQREIGDLLPMLQMRDAVTEEAAQQGASALVQQLRENVERTIAFVEKTGPMDLRNPFDYVGIQMTAEDLIRVPLCAHLESHVEQIREALG
ncbi:MAG TPA: DinB family protein [Actinomycetota bacterium]|nr:DinB family protein [Actinomycetota bacterium]